MRRPDPFRRAADLYDPPPIETADVGETPGVMAKRLDSATVQTPALGVVDHLLLEARGGLRTMFERRERFRSLMEAGVEEQAATERAEAEIPQHGHDRFILSMPPQEGKTERVSRRGTVWQLAQFPGLHVGIVSYDAANAERISRLVKQDVTTYQGQDGLPDLGLRLARDQRAMSRWSLDAPHGGDVYAIGIGGGLTGRPVDLLIIDDPVKDLRAADSLLLSKQAWEWWSTVARPRLAPWGVVIVVSTRWHEADLPGRMLKQQEEDEKTGEQHYDRWRIVNIPAKADHHPERGEADLLGRSPGEYMVSARGRSRAQWEATEAATPARFWQALYQGRPTAEVGDIWQRPWWHRYDTALVVSQPDGTYQIPGAEVVIQSWDFAFRDTDSSDYVAGGVWAKFGADAYLVYEVWKRLDFPATLDAVRRVSRLFPQAHKKVIEAKANGDAVIATLKHELAGIVPAEPTQSKAARATAVSVFIRAGNVHLPTPAVATLHPDITWDVESFLVEATAFDKGPHDDQVDQASQALQELFIGNRIGAAKIEAGAGVATRIPTRVGQATRGPQFGNRQRALAGRRI